MKWISCEKIKCLINKNRLKMNWQNYGKLYNMQVRCNDLWNRKILSNNELAELKKLDFARTKLHGELTNTFIEDNDFTNCVYKSVRRAIAMIMEEDYGYRQLNKLEMLKTAEVREGE